MAIFVRGKKGAGTSGTKTAFRNFRKDVSGADYSDLETRVPYAAAFKAWDNAGRPA